MNKFFEKPSEYNLSFHVNRNTLNKTHQINQIYN